MKSEQVVHASPTCSTPHWTKPKTARLIADRVELCKRCSNKQNKASGKVRRQSEVAFTYTPNGPTLEVLLKTLLRTAALPGQAV